MYNTKVRSELFDSLDYLIPPFKKLPQPLYKDLLYNDRKLTDQCLQRNCNRTELANTSLFKTSESDVQTCSSLILKKTTKQLIHEQYSILNLSTCNRGHNLHIHNKIKQRSKYSKEEGKPTIKVTVIPKVKETQTSKVFNKRCRCSKKIETTVSNQDNSIKNQKIYLLVEGRKREKIHELKISASTKLSNKNLTEKYGDTRTSIEQYTESKQIIKSLNMDRKKRRNNNNKKTVRTHVFDDRDTLKDRYGEKLSKANDRENRVSIVGQLGLTQNDRYILKCAATVNDKPITTNFIDDNANPIRSTKNYNTFHQDSSQYRTIGCNENNCKILRQFSEQDSDAQTDAANPYYLCAATQNNGAASQSTQVNFNYPNPQSIKKFRNQTAQCNCNRVTTGNPLDTDAGDKILKECKSPLVIISVYPRQDKGPDENETVKIIQRQTSPEREQVPNIKQSNNTKEKSKQLTPAKLYTTNKMENKLPRGRSPSPTTKTESKKNIGNKTDTGGRNTSAVKKAGPSQTKKSYVINNLQENTSCHCNNSRFLKRENFNRQQSKIKNNTSNDTEEVKKALVNSFLRNVNVMDKGNRKSMLFQPKDDASRVTININGENDRYDVLLERSNYDTGVSVRKTTKARPPQNFSSEEEVESKSLENFMLLSDERMRKNEYHQVTGPTEQPDVLKIKPTSSRLNIKNSIEIFRRPGQHSNYRFKSHLQNDKNDLADNLFNSDYAPVKHYRGDDCSISDPNERDREIRELLGIMRCQRLQQTEHKASRSSKRVGCCCQKKCSAGLMTGLSVSKFFTSKYLKRKKANTQDQNTQTEPSNDKEKTGPSQKDLQKSNVSRKSKITKKTEHKPVSESADLIKASEEEISETPETTTEDSKDHIHSKDDADDANTKKEKRVAKTIPSKEPSKKKNDVSLHTKDNIMSQNLILNRNIQIFLQVEQFNKERPVVLTRKQYDKVKRIIECSISKKLSIEKRKRCSLKNCNVVSIGEIKVKPKFQLPLRCDREIQTNRSEIRKPVDRYNDKHTFKNTRTHDNRNVMIKLDKNVATDVMATERHNLEQVYPRQAVSTMEIRYASVEYKKRVIISSSSTRLNDITYPLLTSNAERNRNSIHTIFKGHRRSATPNLGTSAYSLYSNVTDAANKSYKQPQCAGDFKAKKPFLQRLISCLVMRSTQTSNLKDAAQRRKVPSVNSSFDSYHISTSLGALEMTSSLYDTSASFYSNHTTMPVNKIKRGFFSSVRGFLTSRRS